MTQREAKRLACRLVAQVVHNDSIGLWEIAETHYPDDVDRIQKALNELTDELFKRGEEPQ